MTLIYLASGILLLHTFIPHSHAEEYNDFTELSSDQADRCIFAFLGVVLEHNFGDDHLERFQVNENHIQDLTIDMVYVVSFSDYDRFVQGPDIQNHSYIDPVPDNPNMKLCHHRGPPLYS